jgi:hypothetical protein
MRGVSRPRARLSSACRAILASGKGAIRAVRVPRQGEVPGSIIPLS